jgi:hypothetical protein
VPGTLNLGRRTSPPQLRPADFRRERPVGHDVARRVVALRGLSVRVEADFGSRPAPPGRVAQVDRLLARLDAAPARRAARGRPAALDALLRPTGPRLWAGVRVGLSAQGRPITLTASGNAAAARRVLVVGCVHGTECAGIAVARRVQRGPGGCPPAEADVWAVPDLDPDGRRLGTRLNGRGVDLNRNFPAGWRPIGRLGDLQYSGPRPFSEPETRAARAIVRSARGSRFGFTSRHIRWCGRGAPACQSRVATPGSSGYRSGACHGLPAPRRAGRTRLWARPPSWWSSRRGH